MSRFLLDTNTVSQMVRGHLKVLRRVAHVPASQMRISAVTLGEIEFGLARRPQAVALRNAIDEVLRRTEVVAWDARAAMRYGVLRAEMARRGKSIALADLQIVAHALLLDAILVTNDPVLHSVPDLAFEDWCA